MEKNSSKKGFFFDLMPCLNLHGKELSYNNLLDVDAAVTLISEFKTDDPTFAILKTTLVPCYKKNDK
jgi:phosphoribosylaminoimidazolecarboxamide formyltransferase/IMP cyclohydrolase